MSRISEILISESPESQMESVEEAEAIAGRGIKGDRYYEKRGTFSPEPHKADFELTMIEKEKVEEFAQDSGLPFTVKESRRNLVTEGIDLNELVGKQFYVGESKLTGIRLCEPCNYLAKISYPEVLKGLVHKGGLRVQILESGKIKVGDTIRVSAENR
ncbi:MAG: MOSC domain-containing protein [Symploca sp. SIO2D2]|nr:MOSC domain-containing protein [Symploca sp. SIO2D2]